MPRERAERVPFLCKANPCLDTHLVRPYTSPGSLLLPERLECYVSQVPMGTTMMERMWWAP